jgi:hypothetical protein
LLNPLRKSQRGRIMLKWMTAIVAMGVALFGVSCTCGKTGSDVSHPDAPLRGVFVPRDSFLVPPQQWMSPYSIHPFSIFARTHVAEEDVGAGDSVIAFWLPDSIMVERVRFVRKP